MRVQLSAPQGPEITIEQPGSMSLGSPPAAFLEDLMQKSDPGIDMAALDDLWDLKGQIGDFSLVQVLRASALKQAVQNSCIRNGIVTELALEHSAMQ